MIGFLRSITFYGIHLSQLCYRGVELWYFYNNGYIVVKRFTLKEFSFVRQVRKVRHLEAGSIRNVSGIFCITQLDCHSY